jgi:PHD/YefM family antitoxin component YafN of YafNO toxin-antitoxin module
MLQSVVSAIQNTVPISQFNRGLAGKIFADVKSNGPKVVMKNNEAEVVLLPPDQYVQLMDILNDYELLSLAVERMENFDASKLISEEEMDRELGITQEEMDSAGEVEFE